MPDQPSHTTVKSHITAFMASMPWPVSILWVGQAGVWNYHGDKGAYFARVSLIKRSAEDHLESRAITKKLIGQEYVGVRLEAWTYFGYSMPGEAGHGMKQDFMFADYLDESGPEAPQLLMLEGAQVKAGEEIRQLNGLYWCKDESTVRISLTNLCDAIFETLRLAVFEVTAEELAGAVAPEEAPDNTSTTPAKMHKVAPRQDETFVIMDR